MKLFFDKESGLLVRQARFIDTAVGLIPLHVDYSDYRAVSGVKMPFHWTVTWVDGQSTTELIQCATERGSPGGKIRETGPRNVARTCAEVAVGPVHGLKFVRNRD